MKLSRKTLLGLAVMLLLPALASAQSLWERRNPRTAYLFQDFRARYPGDLLTIVIDESTEFEGLEKRELNKETKTGANYGLSGQLGNAAVSRSFFADFDGSGASQRKFDSKNNSTIDRRFFDRMTVTVIDVLPNGNLIVEGFRKHMLSREMRTLRIRGIVRQVDVTTFNTVRSQQVGDLEVVYIGRGPESSYTNHGWWGQILNVVWPY
jgi:flagellar L-ring protein precursor FlgH